MGRLTKRHIYFSIDIGDWRTNEIIIAGGYDSFTMEGGWQADFNITGQCFSHKFRRPMKYIREYPEFEKKIIPQVNLAPNVVKFRSTKCCKSNGVTMATSN